jgi:hypothetical protein
MALTDFLTDGQPIPAGTGVRDVTTQTALPDWYTNYAMDILARQQAVAGTPYATAPMPRVAGFTPTQLAGQEMTKAAATAGQPALSSAVGATTGLLGASSLAAAQPYLTQAAGVSGLGTAQPYLTAAGGRSYEDIANYMNPYTQQVVSRIGELGARTLREQLLPQISDRFIQAGQYGGSRQAEMIGRGLRDIYESTLAKQAEALQAGYGEAQTAAAADLARQAQLAGTAGQLGTAAQTGLLDIGARIGTLTGADIAAQREAAQQLGTLAQQQQTMGLAGAGAVTGVGTAEQALQQKNLDVALSDWMTQKGYDQQQINAMLETLKGVKPAVPTAETTAGIEPVGIQGYTPSTGAQIGSAATGVAGLLSAAKDLGWL